MTHFNGIESDMSKNIIIKLFLIIVVSSSSSFVFAASESSNILSVGWELWYPYQYHNNNQQLVGLDFDIFNAIIEEAKLEVTYTELPWKRHLQYIKTGEMDMAMGASYTDERAAYAWFSKPYRVESVKLYVRKGHSSKIELSTLDDIMTSNYMIGVEGGYYYGKRYDELIKLAEFQSHISEVLDLEQNVYMLLKGHIDGFLVDPVTMSAFVEKYKLQGEFEVHSMPVYQDDIYIMLSKKSTNELLLTKINQAIETLKNNGTLDKISKHWSSLVQDDKLL